MIGYCIDVCLSVYTSWIATLKSDLSLHNLTFEDAIELAMDKSLWRLLVASGANALTWCMPNNDDDDDVCLSVCLSACMSVCNQCVAVKR